MLEKMAQLQDNQKLGVQHYPTEIAFIAVVCTCGIVGNLTDIFTGKGHMFRHISF